MAKGDNLSLTEIVEAAETGDTRLQDLLQEAGRNLELVAANLAHLFSPEKIILAGEVPRCCPLLRDTMHQAFQRHTSVPIPRNTYLDWGVLTGFAAALGAAYLGFSKTFPEEERVLTLEGPDQRNAI